MAGGRFQPCRDDPQEISSGVGPGVRFQTFNIFAADESSERRARVRHGQSGLSPSWADGGKRCEPRGTSGSDFFKFVAIAEIRGRG